MTQKEDEIHSLIVGAILQLEEFENIASKDYYDEITMALNFLNQAIHLLKE